jgi:hypothetical protein
LQAYGVSASEYFNLRMADMILWYVWPAIVPKHGIDGLSKPVSELIMREYGRTLGQINMTGFTPKGAPGAPEELDPAEAEIESMHATVVRAQVRKVFELAKKADNDDNSMAFINSAIKSVFGEEKDEIWNTEEISFLNSFMRWAMDRNLFGAQHMRFDEDPVWKKAFDDFDQVVIEIYDRERKRVSEMNCEEPIKFYFDLRLQSQLEHRGYCKITVENALFDGHPSVNGVKGQKEGLRDGKCYVKDGSIYYPMEGETMEEFEEWVFNVFEF